MEPLSIVVGLAGTVITIMSGFALALLNTNNKLMDRMVTKVDHLTGEISKIALMDKRVDKLNLDIDRLWVRFREMEIDKNGHP